MISDLRLTYNQLDYRMSDDRSFALPGSFDKILQNIAGEQSHEAQIEIIAAACREVLKGISDNSHLVLTYPPYFLK